jgi:hypothetical protein
MLGLGRRGQAAGARPSQLAPPWCSNGDTHSFLTGCRRSFPCSSLRPENISLRDVDELSGLLGNRQFRPSGTSVARPHLEH